MLTSVDSAFVLFKSTEWPNELELVVVIDNLFSVIHATVAYLDGIAVGGFSKLVVFRKVFIY